MPKHFSFLMLVFLLAACAANPPDTPLPEGDGAGARETAAPSPTTAPATLTPAPMPSETPAPTAINTPEPTATATATEAPNLDKVSENIHLINSWEDLPKLSDELKVKYAFPSDTFSWSPKDADADYAKYNQPKDDGKDYNFYRPLGTVSDLDKVPVKPLGYYKLPKGTVDKYRSVYLIPQAVFNVDDKTTDILWCAYSFLKEKENNTRFFEEISGGSTIGSGSAVESGSYSLPLTNTLKYVDRTIPEVSYLRDLGLLNPDGSKPKIRQGVQDWFSTGHFPQIFKNVPLNCFAKSFKK